MTRVRRRTVTRGRAAAWLGGAALVLAWSAAPLRGQGAAGAGAERAPSAPPADAAIRQLAGFLSRHPTSAARPTVLLQLAELHIRHADARFAAGGAGSGAGDRPDYAAAIARLDEFLASHPADPRAGAARYTLGVLYTSGQRYGAAVEQLERAAGSAAQPYATEARFRLGDAKFEMASAAGGGERRALFAEAARAYAAVEAAPGGGGEGDLAILALYKLGWALYSAADPARPASYEPALAAFGRLVQGLDGLTPAQRARVGLRGEALEYMAVAFARAGGADVATRYFLRGGARGDEPAVLRRVAASLQEQGDDAGAVRALRVLRAEAPNDSGALAAQAAIVAIVEKRGAAGDSAQAARAALVNDFAPRTAWAAANPALAERAAALRLDALQRGARHALARAQGGERAQYARAAELFGRLAGEFFGTPAAREARLYHAEALLGQGAYAEAGAAYGWAASALLAEAGASDAAARALAERAARNAVVAYDSALSRAPTSGAAQDSLFAAADRLAAAFPKSESARHALVQKGRRAAEGRRWDAMSAAFRAYAARYPADDFAPSAARLVGDALFRQGEYAAAQREWRDAAAAARRRGRAALADSIERSRRAAATAFADSLIARGEHRRAAEEVYVALADESPETPAAAEALRDAVETYLLAIDSGGARGGAPAAANRARAIELAARLARAHPRYPYRVQYQALRARLLVESGRRDEATTLYREQVTELDGSPAAAEPRLRLAVALDSAGRRVPAAAAYEAFAAAHPAHPRAADALHNAAVVYVEAGERREGARVYAQFAARYPADRRAGAARLARVALLRAAGDSAGAAAEFAALCAKAPDGAVRGQCEDAAARRAFGRGVAAFREYQPLRLVIADRAQLTGAGVQRATAAKQRLLRTAVAHFEEAIRSGSAEYVAAGGYYIGLAQHEYGDFLNNAELPAALTEGERAAAANGAAAQAAEYYRAAERSWRALGEKAGSDPALASSGAARPWLDRARATIAGTIDRLGGARPAAGTNR